MIYESNGIAGSGKTTLARKLFNRLRVTDSGVNFIGVATFRGLGKNRLQKYIIKLQRFVLPFNPHNFLFFLNCKRYLRSAPNGSSPLSSRYESYIAILYCVYIFDAYRKNGTNILISDEGILQAITTLSLTRKGNLQFIFSLFETIKKLDSDKVFICCNLSIDEAIKRMNLRDRHDSAIDRLSVAEQKAYLKIYQDRLQLIRAKVDQQSLINIDMTKKNDTLVKSIIEFTRRNFK